MIRLLLALLLLMPATASAFTLTPTSCTFTAQYVEPSTVATGPALTNLVSTAVTYRMAVDGAAPGAAKTVTVPASKPTGGGSISQPITDTTCVPGHSYVISGSATATNTAGTSAATPLASLTIDRSGEVAPNPPLVGGSFQ